MIHNKYEEKRHNESHFQDKGKNDPSLQKITKRRMPIPKFTKIKTNLYSIGTLPWLYVWAPTIERRISLKNVCFVLIDKDGIIEQKLYFDIIK